MPHALEVKVINRANGKETSQSSQGDASYETIEEAKKDALTHIEEGLIRHIIHNHFASLEPKQEYKSVTIVLDPLLVKETVPPEIIDITKEANVMFNKYKFVG